MIKVLDRYISSHVTKFNFLGLTAFFGLFIFIDLATKIFKFSSSKDALTAKKILLFYLYSLPELFLWTGPFIFCLSCFFTLARLQQNSQLVAIMASGIPMRRVIRTLIILAIMLSGIIFFVNIKVAPPSIKEKLKLDEPEIYGSLATTLDANFRDHVTSDDPKFNNIVNYHRTLDFIDIEDVDLARQKSGPLHATFFDESMRPRHKLFAHSCAIDLKNGIISLKKGYLFPYSGQSFNENLFETMSIHINVSLASTLYLKEYIEALSNDEMQYFIHRRDLYVERAFRYLTPLFPIFMLLIALSLGLQALYDNPIYSYFICLMSCLMVLFLSIFLKDQASSEWISPLIAGILMLAVTLGICALSIKRVFDS